MQRLVPMSHSQFNCNTNTETTWIWSLKKLQSFGGCENVLQVEEGAATKCHKVSNWQVCTDKKCRKWIKGTGVSVSFAYITLFNILLPSLKWNMISQNFIRLPLPFPLIEVCTYFVHVWMDPAYRWKTWKSKKFSQCCPPPPPSCPFGSFQKW